MLKFNPNLFKKINKKIYIKKIKRTIYIPTKQKKLVDKLYIQNDEIRFIMETTDRINFCNHDINEQLYSNQSFLLEHNTTMSAPQVHAFQLETLMDALNRKSMYGMKILDIGCGTGYLTACLAKLVGNAGDIYAIDHVRQFIDELPNNFSKCDIPTSNLYIECGDGINGYKKEYYDNHFYDEHFDVIIIGGSLPFVPLKIFNQLKVNGIMIGPQNKYYDQIYYVLKKIDKNKYIKNTISESLVFTPLIELDYQLSRKFLLSPFNYSKRILNDTEILY